MPILLRNVTVSDPVQSSSEPITYLAGTNSSAIPDWALRKMYDDTLWDTGVAPYDPPAATTYATSTDLANAITAVIAGPNALGTDAERQAAVDSLTALLAAQNTIDEMADMNPAGKATGKVISWDATSGKYVLTTPSAGSVPPAIWLPASDFDDNQGTPSFINGTGSYKLHPEWTFPDGIDSLVGASFYALWTAVKVTLLWHASNTNPFNWQVFFNRMDAAVVVDTPPAGISVQNGALSAGAINTVMASVLQTSQALPVIGPYGVRVGRAGNDASDTSTGTSRLLGLLIEGA